MNEKLKTLDLNSLKFVKLKLPRLIPRELIEHVKGKTFTVDQFYEYQEQQVDNPFNLLYALVDSSSVIIGYLWAEMNLLDSSLFVNTFSVSKEYWGNGIVLELAIKQIKELKDKLNAPRVFWVTTNSRYYEKKGFRRSRHVLMEFNEK